MFIYVNIYRDSRTAGVGSGAPARVVVTGERRGVAPVMEACKGYVYESEIYESGRGSRGTYTSLKYTSLAVVQGGYIRV